MERYSPIVAMVCIALSGVLTTWSVFLRYGIVELVELRPGLTVFVCILLTLVGILFVLLEQNHSETLR